MEVFSHRIKWLREKHGLSQREVAEKLGVSQPYYLKFEKNLGEPNLETLVKIPEILGESVEFLLGITDFNLEAGKMFSEYRNLIYERKLLSTRTEQAFTDSELQQAMKHEQFVNYINKQREAANKVNERIEPLKEKLINHLKEIPFVKQESISNVLNQEDSP